MLSRMDVHSHRLHEAESAAERRMAKRIAAGNTVANRAKHAIKLDVHSHNASVEKRIDAGPAGAAALRRVEYRG
jgi:hypothetical protein